MQVRKRGLSAYLSRKEWQLCFSLSFAHQYLGDAGPFDSFADELRYAVSYLAQNGYEFEGIAVTQDGRIVPTTDEPICEENMASVALVVYGSSPDYETHLADAIEFAEEAIPHLTFDIDMLKEALCDIRETVEDCRRAARTVLAERVGVQRV